MSGVNVFEFRFPGEFAGFNLGGDYAFSASRVMASEFGTGQDADLTEHGGVSNGATDVMRPEPPVEGDGFTELGDIGGGTAGKAAAAGNGSLNR